ncbi:unnamed protein product [Phytophthora lilii]|uniref:Unnamed protein product n=1 Tax=Phytophthora lilii TaxID=2077276 RepID=A0A9W6XSZ2_9STRA|nr:unnamed protein product [Phytophthora lilii]
MLLTDMFKYIGDVSVKIQQYNVNKYKSFLQKIINAHGLTGMEIPGDNLGKTYKMSGVEGWIEQGKYASFFDFLLRVAGFWYCVPVTGQPKPVQSEPTLITPPRITPLLIMPPVGTRL